MNSRLPYVALFATSILVPFACAKKPNPPVMPTVSIDAGLEAGLFADGGAPGDGGADASAPVASGPVFFTDAGAPAASGSSVPVASGSAAVPPMTIEATDGAIDLAVAAAAAKVAPKMEKEGQPGRATLAQGEHFNMLITMQPGRCYTLVGYSPAGGVTQLDLKLFAPPLFNIESGKSGATDKNQPVIGKGAQAMCPVLPLPIAYKIDAVATKGTGRIGVHVYSRAK